MRYGAVIVAAGMSTRMKRFKQLMKIGDMSIAERVIVNFRLAGVSDIVMVTGCNAEQLENALKDFDLIFVRNKEYATTQMFDSARLGLEQLRGKCDSIFFCPVDVPFFSDETVHAEKTIMEHRPEIDVVLPECRGRDGHPLLIRESVLPQILAHDGNNGMRGAYESLPRSSVARVEVDDEGSVIDADTREDYRKLIDIHNERILHPVINISFASTSPFLNPETVNLLREIDRRGNVRDACEKCGFSYSKGWTIIRNCEEKFGHTIVDRKAGGENGGTARVTDKGYDLVSIYEEIERELEALANIRFRELISAYQITGEALG